MRLKNSLLSFALAFISILCIFAVSGVLFGELSMFQGDDFQQYISFINDFIRTIKGDGFVWYSFANYLGSGNVLNIAYYCLSPFNVLFLICNNHIFLAYFLVVSLKISLAAATFYFFISELTKKNRYYYFLASLFYCLSGWAVTWYFDIMWLDALYILPVLIAFIIQYVEGGKYLFLIITYSYLFITNFYMAYIVGVFSAIFFLSYLLYKENYTLKGKYIYYINKCVVFAGVVILAAGICAGLLLSVAGFLSEHMAHDNVEFEALSISLFDILNSMFLGEFQTMDNKVPVLYAGLPVMGLSIYFYTNRKIDLKIKLFWGTQLSFYVVGMLFLPLYKLLHAFDYPNFYGYRFSGVVVFVLVAASCTAVEYLESKDFIFFKWLLAGGVLFYSFMMTFQKINFSGARLNSQAGLLINALFMALWLGILFLYIKYKEKSEVGLPIKIFLILLTMIEVICNGCICIRNTDFVFIEKNLIKGWYYSEKKAVENIKNKDGEFYRVYVNNEINTNAAKMFGYNGLNTFSSADNYLLRMTLSRLGESTSNRYIRSNCSVPVFDSLFGVKYYINMKQEGEYLSCDLAENEYEAALVEENPYSLKLGYMVSSNILSYKLTDNAFDNLDNLCSAMVGEEMDIYNNITLDDDDYLLVGYEANEINNRLYFDRMADLYDGESGLYIMLDDCKDNRYVEFSYDAPGSYGSFPVVGTDVNGAYHSKLLAEGGVYKMGNAMEHNYIKATFVGAKSPDFFVDAINIGEYNEEVFVDVYEELSKNQFMINDNRGDYISGTVIATEDKPYLFTTIPYDPEWHIYVDGKPISKLYRVIGDAFMAIELTPGEHTVTFQYVEKWSNEGMIISLISIIIFLGLILRSVIRVNGSNIKATDDVVKNK